MFDLQMGPFMIQSTYLFLLLSMIITVLITYVLLTHYKAPFKKVIITEWVQSILIIIIIWKFSYILIHPIQSIQSPLRMIYFDGGTIGWVVGVNVAFLLYRKALLKQPIQPPLIHNIFLFAGFILFGLNQVFVTFLYSVYWQEAIFGFYFIALATLFFYSEGLYSNRRAIRAGQWAVVGWIGHDIIRGSIHMNDWVLWSAFGVGATLLILDYRLDKGSENNA